MVTTIGNSGLDDFQSLPDASPDNEKLSRLDYKDKRQKANDPVKKYCFGLFWFQMGTYTYLVGVRTVQPRTLVVPRTARPMSQRVPRRL
jgi:hypothetical protein